MNDVKLSGRLAKEVDLKYLTDETPVSTIILAVDMGLSKEKKEEFEKKGKATAEFIAITTYGKNAENVAKYLEKGSQVLIEARLHVYKYDKDGEIRYITQVIAKKIEFIGGKKKNNSSTDDAASIFEEDDKCFLDNPGDENIPL